MILILTSLIFLVTLGLLMSAAYFYVLAPMQRQNWRTRLASVQQMSVRSEVEPESEILRRQMLSDIPALQVLLEEMPVCPAALNCSSNRLLLEMQIASFLLIVLSAGLLVALVAWFLICPCTRSRSHRPWPARCHSWLVAYKRSRRFSHFEEQFPDALDLLARAVRAGHAFTTAFSLIGEEMADPVAAEFTFTHRQQSLGLPLREALGNMATVCRCPTSASSSRPFKFRGTPVAILAKSSTLFPPLFGSVFKIMREVRVLTAEGRLSMYFLVGTPIFVGIMMNWVNPEKHANSVY